MLRFSTDDFPEHKRIDAYREIYSRTIVKHDVEPLGDQPFRFEADLRSLPDSAWPRLTFRRVIAGTEPSISTAMISYWVLRCAADVSSINATVKRWSGRERLCWRAPRILSTC